MCVYQSIVFLGHLTHLSWNHSITWLNSRVVYLDEALFNLRQHEILANGKISLGFVAVLFEVTDLFLLED